MNTLLTLSLAFSREEADQILEALYFFEAQKEFSSDEEYNDWRNTLKKVEGIIQEAST